MKRKRVLVLLVTRNGDCKENNRVTVNVCLHIYTIAQQFGVFNKFILKLDVCVFTVKL
jgi:hypothetical protein